MKNRLKVILSAITLLFTMSIAIAQNTVTGTTTVCDTDVRPMKLGEDVVGISLTPTGGTWAEVQPVAPYNAVIENNVSNVFVGIDRQPGKYAFVYTANNNVCMANGDKAIAIIEVLETPKPVNIRVVLCPNETKNVDLNNYISSTLKAKYPSGIVFKNSSGTEIANGIFNITSSFAGVADASYEVSGLTASGCTSSSTINIAVIRDGGSVAGNLSGEKNFCLTAMPSSINLSSELGLAANGQWATDGTSLAITTNGIVDLSNVTTAGVHKYKFTADGTSSCIAAGTLATYTISILEDMSTLITSEGSTTLCKTENPTMRVNLQSLLNISIPANAGEWTADASNPANTVDVTDGYFEVANAPLAGTYTYKIKVSNAISLCGLENKEGTVKIILEEGGRLVDEEVQICSDNIPTSLDLSAQISGIQTNTTTWYQADGTTEIPTGKIDPSQLGGVGTYKYIYKTGSSSGCKSEGSLHITIEDQITNLKDKTISYCLTDEGSDAIDLDVVLGVVGVPGTWTTAVTGANYNATTHVFNGRAEAGSGPYPKTYTFTFTADSSAGCGLAGKKATVTVKITDQLIP